MTLHKELADALQLEAIMRNPTDGVRLPRIPENETQWYSDAQLNQLLCATDGDRFHALWVTLGTLGLRLGEALGLQWSDIHGSTIAIRRTCQRNRLTGTLELAELKTKGSRSTLTLPADATRALQPHRDRQDFERKRQSEAWTGSDLIFCTITGGLLDQSRIHEHWTPACAKAGIPRYRVHDLRHSVASNLIAGGMGLLEVASLLGHRNATMVTQVYGHLAPDDHKRAAALMDALLNRQRAAIQ